MFVVEAFAHEGLFFPLFFISSSLSSFWSCSFSILLLLSGLVTRKSYFLVFLYIFKLILERGTGERNGGEKHRLAGCLPHAPGLGIGPTTWVCALIRDQIHSPLMYGMTLQLSHTGQGSSIFLEFVFLFIL